VKCICEALQVPESFLYLYSFEREDVPEGKREKYDLVFPLIHKLIQEVADEGTKPKAGGDEKNAK
jgi:hypothetical protein